jgi:hypothetical protein
MKSFCQGQRTLEMNQCQRWCVARQQLNMEINDPVREEICAESKRKIG